jgi:hypothetical protein
LVFLQTSNGLPVWIELSLPYYIDVCSRCLIAYFFSFLPVYLKFQNSFCCALLWTMLLSEQEWWGPWTNHLHGNLGTTENLQIRLRPENAEQKLIQVGEPILEFISVVFFSQ